uniref:Uncharacterized protein n=1 Tax=Tanacetum cinerariifolium TaxID=118510 RepID=A0A699L8Y0_TANCI|nr:hypothetical protein [Tanacetum cinerariifolium]
MVKDLMNSLSRRYERLRQILKELEIQSALPASEQAPSQTSGRKQKHMELEPEKGIPRLEGNRTLPENVPFVNNMVIEEPEYGISSLTNLSALPASEQAPSQTSGRKQKHMELEPEKGIPRLEGNRTLPENVPFVNNMVIEEPEYGISSLTNLLHIWSSLLKMQDSALRKLIAEHPDQEKLKSKKVKLEALGYNMD